MPREISYEKIKQLEELYKINLGLKLSVEEIKERTGLNYPAVKRYFNSIEEFYNNLGDYKATALRKNVFPYAREHKKKLVLYNPRLANLVRNKLDEVDMTQKELAQKTGIKLGTIASYLNGKYISKDSKQKIFKVLKIGDRTIDDFLK